MLYPTALALTALLAHVLTSVRYGYFRDELYFIACSRHLAWGYVDQPPLVAVAAWLCSPFAYTLPALRLLPAIAAALTVWLAARMAREFGGGTFAQAFAALAALLLPAYLLLGNTLTTTSFEPLSWALFIYATVRLVRTGEQRYWLAAGAAFSFGMYGKYSMLLLGASVLIGLLVTKERKFVATPWFLAGLGLAAGTLAPNIAWQWTHGWPFVHVVQGDFAHRHPFQTGLTLEYTSLTQNARAFVLEQLLYTNPIAVPLWLAGSAALACSPRLRSYRFLAVAFFVLLVLAIWLEAKGYYIIGMYTVLLAAGSAALESALSGARRRAAVTAVFVVLTLAFVPLSLPVLPVDTFIRYTAMLGLTGQNGTPPRLIQPMFAEEFGWDELARHVANVYNALPSSVRARTAVFADTYGDAGALDFYGPRYGLPAAISTQNTYYLWGTRGYDGTTLILVGATRANLFRKLYRSMRLVATYGNPYKWVVEGPTPIYLCTDPIAPLGKLWPRLKWYGA